MDTNQLKAFIAVTETGSFSLAAEKLHLTQPAVSKRISVLEEILGARLFDRIGKRVILTEAGQVLQARARKIMRELDDARISIQNLSTDIAGRLSLASSHHIGLHRLPPVLKKYSSQHPEVVIDISFLDSEQAYERVLHGEIELAVVTLAPEKIDRINSHTLWPDPLSIMTSRGHTLTKSSVVKLEDLLDYPVILPAEQTFTRQVVEQLFQSKGLLLDVEMSTNYLETIKMMVSVGMAWSVLPDSMLGQELQALPVSGARLSRNLGYICHRDHTLSNAATAFIDLLEKHRSAI